MTIDQLATEIETAYWGNNATRVMCGEEVSQDEEFAARAHLPTLARYTARAAAKWARRAHRPARFQPPFIADTVADGASSMLEFDGKSDKRVGVLIETIGWIILNQLLQNLAWRFAAWLLSDATHEDRPDLICKMEAE